MKLFKNIKTLTRIQLFVSILYTGMFIIASIFFYYQRKSDIEKDVESKMERELNEIAGIINIYLKRDRDILDLAVTSAENRISEYANIEETENSELTFEAADPFTNLPLQVKIKVWLLDNTSILYNNSLVDELNKLTKLDVSIYQKSDKGFVNVSTSLKNPSEERMTGDIVLNTSPIAESVLQGNQFMGRVFQRNSWYLASYRPIYIDGKIKGMYYLGVKERIGRTLKDIFTGRKYFDSGYPFLITKQGILLVHPDRQGEDLSSAEVYKKLRSLEEGERKLIYKWPETDKGKLWDLHFQFHDESQAYICVTYPRSEVAESLSYFLLYIVIAYLLFLIVLQVLFYFAHHSIRSKLRSLRLALNLLSKGHTPGRLNLSGEKEFVELSDRINQISLRFREMADFANGLANDNFTQKYPSTLVGDEIGEALIRINDKLNEAMYNEHIRIKEEKLRLWESEGLSKFVNILQRNRDNLDELCYEIIHNLVQYLNANIGALFFINFDDVNNVYFEQMATFAYEQRRLVEKKIYPEQGFIGRIYNEKQTIYLSEIPDDYINISSGLGGSSPKNLLIVPLLINKEVYGAIEIASFNIIKGYQIEFIEKIGENIASTINNVLVNNKTRELLKQSRAQSELLSMQEEEMRRNILELENIQIESDVGLYEKRVIFKLIDQVLLLVEIDHSGIILSVNDNVPSLFLMDKANIVGKHFSDYSYYVPIEEYKGLISSWELLKSGEKIQVELKMKSGAGKMINVLTTMIPLMENDQLVKIIIMGIELSSE